MLAINKTVEEWVYILKDYVLLKDKISNVLNDFYAKKEVLNFFWKHDIRDIQLGYLLMNKLSEYHSFDNYIQELCCLSKKKGINNVAFILDNNRPSFLVYLAYSGYKFAYFPRDIFPKKSLDLNGGGICNSLYSWPTYQFIIDEVCLNKHERTLYTNTFYHVSNTFPSKEEMDYPSIEEFRFELFDMILYYFSSYSNYGCFSIDMLEEYKTSNEENRLLTDGDIFKGKRQDAWVIVKNACFVLENKLDNLELRVNPIFLEKYKEHVLLEKDYRKLAFLDGLQVSDSRLKR